MCIMDFHALHSHFKCGLWFLASVKCSRFSAFIRVVTLASPLHLAPPLCCVPPLSLAPSRHLAPPPPSCPTPSVVPHPLCRVPPLCLAHPVILPHPLHLAPPPPSHTLREARELSVSQPSFVFTKEGADGPSPSPAPPVLEQSPQVSSASELRQLRGHTNNKIVLVRVLNTEKDKVRSIDVIAKQHQCLTHLRNEAIIQVS